MFSEKESAANKWLPHLKSTNRRFVVLAPCRVNEDNTHHIDTREPLMLHHFEALVNARVFAGSMKGKYGFIFDLVNEGHFNKLIEMLDHSSSYRIYVETSLSAC